MEILAGIWHGSGEEMELEWKSSAGSRTDGLARREDLDDFGRQVSISTIFGLLSKPLEALSRLAESLLLWNDDKFSLRQDSSNLSCVQRKHKGKLSKATITSIVLKR
ncbi:hypothetical protein C4D60_Mb06t15470 [Musa balbisiana]|uniref:Uncharacterized protein n=1 Tax=Musa balbisiana TaxID=52838 RepID=A0A4S8INZ3_MUSBA|nr:hypothetical protein C4D60_Mb06t15470 [Musa balbisiana]